MARAGAARGEIQMTEGSLWKNILLFSIPLVFSQLLQVMFNMADVAVVGKFASDTALGSVGSTSTLVTLFTGFLIGMGNGVNVRVAQHLGAQHREETSRAVHTAFLLCLLAGVGIMVLCLALAANMLEMLHTKDDLLPGAVLYFRIYALGMPALGIFNFGNAVLSASGDTKRPLYFLCLSSVINIGLDLLFVVGFGMAIEGVAYATIISQFVSAILVLIVLTRSTENYRLTWKDLRINKKIFRQILMIGLPTGFQQSLTSFSNVYVQSYINTFGSSCMAGWSSYSKIDQFVFLPMQSIGQASTTFMSQNLGAGNLPRAKKGTGVALRLALLITFASAGILFLFAPRLVAVFNQGPDVFRYGTMFLRMNVFMLAFCCPNQVVAGAMRGAGDSRTPMLIMLFSFVLFRQIYLYIATSICNTAAVVGFGYPVGWIVASVLVELYYMSGKWEKKINM